MLRETIYERWAPQQSVWSLWTRPNLFTQMTFADGPCRPACEAGGLPVHTGWLPTAREKTALLIDLPGAESIWWGLALVGRGYRPVPVFETCTGPCEVIDQRPILAALRGAAVHLAEPGLAADAPPAFLVDARRMCPPSRVRPGALDNRWMVAPGDFPSAGFLTARGITRALLVQRGRHQPQADAARVLRAWQEGGLAIAAADLTAPGSGRPLQPSRLAPQRPAWRRLLALVGKAPIETTAFGVTA